MVEVADVDDIYAFGKLVKREKARGDFESINIWDYKGVRYYIGRNYKEGESIVLDAERIKKCKFGMNKRTGKCKKRKR